jgi:hypothetical protein
MPEQVELETIKRIATQLASYYRFPGFDQEDIKQEATLIGISVFDKFDSAKGKLDDFLFRAIKNGLLNLKVKHYHNPKTKSEYGDSKKAIIGFSSIQEDTEYSHPFDDVEIHEVVELVDRYLHPHFKKDYAKIKEGIYIGTVRRNKILLEVERIYKLIMEDRVDDLEKQFQNR